MFRGTKRANKRFENKLRFKEERRTETARPSRVELASRPADDAEDQFENESLLAYTKILNQSNR